MKNKFLLLLALATFLTGCKQDPKAEEPVSEPAEPVAVREWKPEDTRTLTGVMSERGLISKTDAATPGYVMFHPSESTKTVLMSV